MNYLKKEDMVKLDEELYFKVSNGVKINNIWDIKDKVIFKYKNNLIGIYETEGNYFSGRRHGR